MKKIIQERAKDFFDWEMFNSEKSDILESVQSSISSKLNVFYEGRDKIIFLRELKLLTIQAKVEHEQSCDKKYCPFSKEHDIALFCIEQEIKSIQNSHEYQKLYGAENKFTPEEELELITRLDRIEEMLVKTGFGQEIIFDEISELKNNMNLGKKNWFQFLKGKLFDLGTEKILDKLIIENVWKALKSGFEEVSKMLP